MRPEKDSIKKSLKILNTREKKHVLKSLEDQWGDCFPKKDFVFLLNNKNRLYLADPDIAKIDLEKLKIDHIGLYFGTVEDAGIRLSIEGAQMVGPKARKNIIVIDDAERDAWLRGDDIDADTCRCDSTYVLIKNKDDFLGCGKQSGNKITNFVPKARRVAAKE